MPSPTDSGQVRDHVARAEVSAVRMEASLRIEALTEKIGTLEDRVGGFAREMHQVSLQIAGLTATLASAMEASRGRTGIERHIFGGIVIAAFSITFGYALAKLLGRQ